VTKKLLYIIFFIAATFSFAQQNDEFKYVKEFYDSKRILLADAFKKEISKQQTIPDINRMEADFSEFMGKLDSIQNVAMLSALIKVKNREDLQNIKISKKDKSESSVSYEIKENEIPAQYPGGIDELRKQVAHIFYFDALMPDVSKMSASIQFIVEKDGSISTVRADGENFVFNRQAEIAVYMLPEKFTPAVLNGEKIRYSFRVPLTMNFK